MYTVTTLEDRSNDKGVLVCRSKERWGDIYAFEGRYHELLNSLNHGLPRNDLIYNSVGTGFETKAMFILKAWRTKKGKVHITEVKFPYPESVVWNGVIWEIEKEATVTGGDKPNYNTFASAPNVKRPCFAGMTNVYSPLKQKAD